MKLYSWLIISSHFPIITLGNDTVIPKGNQPQYSRKGLLLKLKLQYFGQLMQRANLLEKTLMQGKIEDKRRKGHKRMRRLDSITDSMVMKLSKIQEIVEGRRAWGAAIHGVAELDTS